MTVVSVEKDYEALALVMVAEFGATVERVWHCGPIRASSSAGGVRRRTRPRCTGTTCRSAAR